MKHERGIKAAPKQNWRLKKTLARRLEFRPIEQEDLRYAWAAYKGGALASMGENWAAGDKDPTAFAEAFQVEVSTLYHGAWTMFAENKKGFIPVGFVLGFWSHPTARFSPFMIVGDILWCPWASARNRIESAVNFFNRIRSDIAMVEYASEQNKRFFEMICQHGIMRRVGTTFNVYKDEPTAVFETRRP